MSTRKRRGQSESDSRGLILDAATELFAEKGYAATKVQEIVGRAGVTKPVLYYYFRNKEGLFKAILERAGKLQEDVMSEVWSSSGSALDRFQWFYNRVYEELVENRDLFRFIHHVVFAQPRGTPRFDIAGHRRRTVEVLSRICEQGIEQGELADRDPGEMAMMVLAIVDFCVHHDFLHPESADRERPNRMLGMAFGGLGPVAGGNAGDPDSDVHSSKGKAKQSCAGKSKR